MQRRPHCKAKPGQLYAVEWPEWHVDCAAGCNSSALVAGQGEAMTLRDAERVAKKAESLDGYELNDWAKVKGLWYCPRHKPTTTTPKE